MTPIDNLHYSESLKQCLQSPLDLEPYYYKIPTPEQLVEYLYDQILSGTAKKYREIERWIFAKDLPFFEFKGMLDFLETDIGGQPKSHWEYHLKELLRKAIDNQPK